MKITHCKTSHLVNPVGYLLQEPVFSWCVEEAAGKRQESARIVVKSGGITAADTGWGALCAPATAVSVPLTPRTRYTWTVRVRSDAGEEAQSEEQFFETGKLDEAWQACWITAPAGMERHPVFSRAITPRGPVLEARLYICGLGLYEAAWNGRKLGDEYLTPYCNNYNAWVQYQTLDVTQQLQQAGVLSVTLGNGWYRGRFRPDDRTGQPYYGTEWKLLAELRLQYADGSEEVIGTGPDWLVTASNITFSNIYDGEIRDDTLPELTPAPAVQTAPPQGRLTERLSPPVRVQEELPVQEIIHTPAGETVLDLGVNLTGSFRLRLHAPRGQQVHLQFGEILQDGCFYRENLRTAKAAYTYISGGEQTLLEPKFTFYGYRYVKVEGLQALEPADFTALVLHTDLEKTGELTTGSPLVNQLLANIDRGLRGNFLDVPTDCPQRDERMGWTGDAQVFAPTANYLRDACAFYRKYLYDLRQEQEALDGAVPEVVPSFGMTDTSAAWGDAACILPWTLYQYYGDRSILEEQYQSMQAWVAYIRRVDGDNHGWRRKFHFGDWLALDAENPENLQGGTETGFVADVQYLRSVRILADTAAVLGKAADETAYRALADGLLLKIRREYFTPSGRAAIATQTGLLLALRYNLSPDPARTTAQLAARMKADGGHLKTGFVGTPLLLPVLSESGMDEAAYALLLYEGYPGWLYAVKLGATTVWERWDSVGPDGKIAENGMNSLNHYAYGSVAEWICGYAAGLQPAAPGFRQAVLAPRISPALGSIRYAYRSAAGLWESAWELTQDGQIHYSCTVPFACTASLTLPYGGGSFALEAGRFEITYTPDRPLKTVYTVDTPLCELLDNAKVKAALTRAMPKITQLPPSMRSLSIRQIMTRMGGADETALAGITKLLQAVT